MHRAIYAKFEQICHRRGIRGHVLEIGALPTPQSLLHMACLAGCTKVGLNLEGPAQGVGYEIHQGDANDMHMFDSSSFDAVLCNAVLEHDKFFWKTLAEIRRVAKPGALVVIGAPGYVRLPGELWLQKFFRRSNLVRDRLNLLAASTLTFRVHKWPGDYYRFGVDAFNEVIFEGMDDVEVESVIVPPRLIGSGRVAAR